jgi:surfeit locus 1 family protein
VSRRIFFFVLFALAVSLGCLRLGFWQISRLRERQARNAMVLGRLREPAVPVQALLSDTGARFRHATASGRYDFDHELIYAIRPRDGAPGVNILTPLRTGRGDTAVLVNRGWVYSPDGMSLDLNRWREVDSANVDGFVEVFVPAEIAVTTSSTPRAVRRLDADSIRARIPYPLLPLLLVQQQGQGTEARAGLPVRVEPPPLSEGPHRSYAIQWFGFALTGIVGTVLVAARDRRRKLPGERHHVERIG